MSESAGAGASASAASPVTNSESQAGEGQKPSSPVPDFRGTKHKVKVDGQEQEVEYDELVRDYQMKQAAQKRMQQAAEQTKKAERALKLEEAFSKGDLATLKKLLPRDQFTKVSEDLLIEQMEWESLPKYEQKRILAERRAQELEDEIKQRDEKTNKEQLDKEMADAATAVDEQISEALGKLGRAPTPYLVGALIDEMLAVYDTSKGQKKLTAEEALKKAQRRIDGDVESYLMGMKPEEFVSKIPASHLDAVRQHLLSQVGMQPRKQNAAASEQKPRDRGEAPKRMSIDEYYKNMEDRFKKRRSS